MRRVGNSTNNLVRYLAAGLFAVLAADATAQSAGHACIQGLGMGNQQIWWTGGSNSKYVMDFTGGAPVLSNTGIGQTSSIEGTAVYTTPDGDLLLYTDGNAIFNGQTHGLIGTGVGGNPSATEAALIVPDPAGVPTNDFYVFGNTASVSGDEINFTLVDISGNSIGPVTPLGGGVLFSESLATVPHSNGTDFWILSVTNATPTVNAYLVTSAGVSGTAVSSPIPALPGGTTANRGTLIYHPPTGQLAISFYSTATSTGFIHTAQFNESTGVVSGFSVRATGNLGYGVAFSPDASKLYFSTGSEGYSGTIMHLDIGAGVSTPIQGGQWAMPRLAPDGKVYVVDYQSTTMGVINSPNSAFASIGWNPTEISLPAGAQAAFGLVNQTYAPCQILNQNVPPVSSFVFSCNELDCSFDGSGSSDSDGTVVAWNWDFGDSGAASGVTAAHSFVAAGTYTVSLTVTDDDDATGTSDQQVTVTVAPPPPPAPPPPSTQTVPVPALGFAAMSILALLLGLIGYAVLRRD